MMEETERSLNEGGEPADTETREVIEEIARKLGDGARAEVVFGEPVERDGITVIPVAAASLGLGAGGGPRGGSREGAGVGGGMRVSPVGYIEVTQRGVRFRRVLPTWAFVSIALGLCALGALLLFDSPRHE